MQKVLIVSHDLSVLAALKRMIGRHYDVLTTDDGQTALSLLRDFKQISAIVSDMQASDMSGPELLEQAAGIAPDASLALLKDDDWSVTATRIGTDTHPFWHEVEKPIDASKLLALLDRLTSAQADHPAQDKAPVDDRDVVGALKKADPDQEFSMLYQPRICTKTGETRCVEALLRWNSAAFAEISPAHFIPLAEETGDIIWITDWTLQTACNAARAWLDLGNNPIPVSVNLTASICSDPRLVGLVVNALRVSGIPRDLLLLEITQGPDFCDNPIACSNATVLRDLGIQISFDGIVLDSDNGVSLPPRHTDCLRAGHSLIGRIADENRRGVLHSLRDVAMKLGVHAVVAGVENAQHVSFIRQLGIDQMQGFHISKPLSQADLPAWVKSQAMV